MAKPSCQSAGFRHSPTPSSPPPALHPASHSTGRAVLVHTCHLQSPGDFRLCQPRFGPGDLNKPSLPEAGQHVEASGVQHRTTLGKISPMQELGKLRHWVPKNQQPVLPRAPLRWEVHTRPEGLALSLSHLQLHWRFLGSSSPAPGGHVPTPSRCGGLCGSWLGAACPGRECFWQRWRGEKAALCICWAANRWLGSGAVTVLFAAQPVAAKALSLQREAGTLGTRDTAVCSLGRCMGWVPALERVPNTSRTPLQPLHRDFWLLQSKQGWGQSAGPQPTAGSPCLSLPHQAPGWEGATPCWLQAPRGPRGAASGGGHTGSPPCWALLRALAATGGRVGAGHGTGGDTGER